MPKSRRDIQAKHGQQRSVRAFHKHVFGYAAAPGLKLHEMCEAVLNHLGEDVPTSKAKRLRVAAEAARSAPRANVKPAKSVKSAPTKDEKLEFYASWGWRTLRMKILKEFGRKCMCCGASPDHGVRIVVDHIKPLSLHWDKRLDPDNLQVLCDECNQGKGNWCKDDYR